MPGGGRCNRLSTCSNEHVYCPNDAPPVEAIWVANTEGCLGMATPGFNSGESEIVQR
jgi:hypothetical protein